LRKFSRLIKVPVRPAKPATRQSKNIFPEKRKWGKIKHKKQADPDIQQTFLYAGFFHVLYSINILLSQERLEIHILLTTGFIDSAWQHANGILPAIQPQKAASIQYNIPPHQYHFYKTS